MKIHTRLGNKKNLLVNYYCTHESSEGSVGKKIAPSIFLIGRIHLKKENYFKILVLSILKIKF